MRHDVARPRVLQLITSLAGGAGLHALQLAQQLDARRFAVELAFGPGYPLDEEVRRLGLPHHVLGWSRQLRPLPLVAGSAALWRLLRAQRWDIVHAHCSLAGAVGRPLARLAGNACTVFTVHALPSQVSGSAWRRGAVRWVERALDAATDAYCVGNHMFGRHLVDSGIAGAERVVHLPVGIEVSAARAGAAQVAAARQRLGLARDDLVVATAGRFEPQKALHHLLQAFATLQRRLPRALLVLFGAGPLQPALQAQAAELGLTERVRFAGWQPDMAAVLPAADVFCLSSLWEGLPYALLDAMAVGVPIVATDVGGVAEALDNGRCGRLVAPGQPAALADALTALLADAPQRATLASAAHARLHSHYALPRMLDDHTRLYERLLAARAARGLRLAAR